MRIFGEDLTTAGRKTAEEKGAKASKSAAAAVTAAVGAIPDAGPSEIVEVAIEAEPEVLEDA